MPSSQMEMTMKLDLLSMIEVVPRLYRNRCGGLMSEELEY